MATVAALIKLQCLILLEYSCCIWCRWLCWQWIAVSPRSKRTTWTTWANSKKKPQKSYPAMWLFMHRKVCQRSKSTYCWHFVFLPACPPRPANKLLWFWTRSPWREFTTILNLVSVESSTPLSFSYIMNSDSKKPLVLCFTVTSTHIHTNIHPDKHTHLYALALSFSFLCTIMQMHWAPPHKLWWAPLTKTDR